MDVEGTTTSIKFWKKTLVPYVKRIAETFFKERNDSPAVIACVDDLREESRERAEKDGSAPQVASKTSGEPSHTKSIIKYLNYCLNNSYYTFPIQNLLLLIWMFGYERKDIKGHVYPDVAKALKEWAKKNSEGKCQVEKIYVISSGKADAQRLLFAYSTAGTLSPYITEFLDAREFGDKKEQKTYVKIAKQIGEDPEEIVFFTDNPKEAKAATSSGYLAILVEREENKPLTSEDKESFKVIESFEDVEFMDD